MNPQELHGTTVSKIECFFFWTLYVDIGTNPSEQPKKLWNGNVKASVDSSISAVSNEVPELCVKDLAHASQIPDTAPLCPLYHKLSEHLMQLSQSSNLHELKLMSSHWSWLSIIDYNRYIIFHQTISRGLSWCPITRVVAFSTEGVDTRVGSGNLQSYAGNLQSYAFFVRLQS